MKQKNVQKDNVNGTGNLVVEKIVESKKGGIFVLAMVLLFWCALLFALPAMAAEKTCAVSIPVSVKMTGNGSDSQTQKNPAFTVVMEAADGQTFQCRSRTRYRLGQLGAGHLTPFCIQHLETMNTTFGSLAAQIRTSHTMLPNMM